MTAASVTGVSLAASLVAVLVSSILRGITGFGFAIAATPLLAVAYEPRLAVAVVILLQVGIGLIDGPRAWKEAYRPPLTRLIGGAVIGTPLGMSALVVLGDRELRLVVAGLTLCSLVAILRRPGVGRSTAVPPAVVGFLAGMMNGVAAMPGPPVVAYVLRLPISEALSRALLILFFAVASIIAAVSGLLQGVIGPDSLVIAACSFPALLIGNAFGARLFKWAPSLLYRPTAITLLFAAAAVAFWRGFEGY